MLEIDDITQGEMIGLRHGRSSNGIEWNVQVNSQNKIWFENQNEKEFSLHILFLFSVLCFVYESSKKVMRRRRESYALWRQRQGSKKYPWNDQDCS